MMMSLKSPFGFSVTRSCSFTLMPNDFTTISSGMESSSSVLLVAYWCAESSCSHVEGFCCLVGVVCVYHLQICYAVIVKGIQSRVV
jgi:hypothetical protein